MPGEDRIFGWSTGAHPAVDIAQEIGLESFMERTNSSNAGAKVGKNDPIASLSDTARCKMKQTELRITSIRFFAFPLAKGHIFCLTTH
jgi:hypothetical protein